MSVDDPSTISSTGQWRTHLCICVYELFMLTSSWSSMTSLKDLYSTRIAYRPPTSQLSSDLVSLVSVISCSSSSSFPRYGHYRIYSYSSVVICNIKTVWRSLLLRILQGIRYAPQTSIRSAHLSFHHYLDRQRQVLQCRAPTFGQVLSRLQCQFLLCSTLLK